MGESIDAHELGHPHRTGLRDAADVVPREVHEHHVLGALLLRRTKLGLVRGVRRRVGPARAGAGDRMHHHPAVFDAYERLGRRPDERHTRRLEQEHVRRRVHVPQRAVQREGLRRRLDVEPLGQHDLDAIAVGDELAGPARERLVRRGCHVRAKRPLAARRRREHEWSVEERVDLVDPAFGRGPIAIGGVRDDEHRVPQVVERDDRVVDAERGIGRVVRIARCQRQVLEVASGLVRDVADGAPGEPRQSRAAGPFVAGHRLP